MIIRRRQTEAFTVIANAVCEDTGISFEALGVLVYLLSRPHNWEVRLEHLRASRAIGRDRMQRYMRELIDAGYIKRFKRHDPISKRFRGDEYWVFDSPQATDDEYDESVETDVQADLFKPEPENRPVAREPEPEKPSPGNQSLESRSRKTGLHNKDGKQQELKNQDETTQGAQARGGGFEFEDFKEAFDQGDPSENWIAAQREWARLSQPDREAAVSRAAAYTDFCRRKGRKRCGAPAFLRDRRWRGFEIDKPKRERGPADMVIFPRSIEWAVYRWITCNTRDLATIRKLDQFMRDRKPIRVKPEPLRAEKPDTWVWCRQGTEAWDLWSLFHQSRNWPVPPTVTHPDKPEDGYWFPADLPPTAVTTGGA